MSTVSQRNRPLAAVEFAERLLRAVDAGRLTGTRRGTMPFSLIGPEPVDEEVVAP